MWCASFPPGFPGGARGAPSHHRGSRSARFSYPPPRTLSPIAHPENTTLKIRHIHRQARTHIHTHLRTRAPLGVVEGLFRPSKCPGVLGGAEGGLYSKRHSDWRCCPASARGGRGGGGRKTHNKNPKRDRSPLGGAALRVQGTAGAVDHAPVVCCCYFKLTLLLPLGQIGFKRDLSVERGSAAGGGIKENHKKIPPIQNNTPLCLRELLWRGGITQGRDYVARFLLPAVWRFGAGGRAPSKAGAGATLPVAAVGWVQREPHRLVDRGPCLRRGPRSPWLAR